VWRPSSSSLLEIHARDHGNLPALLSLPSVPTLVLTSQSPQALATNVINKSPSLAFYGSILQWNMDGLALLSGNTSCLISPVSIAVPQGFNHMTRSRSGSGFHSHLYSPFTQNFV
jgi:hypothetical protein